MTIKNITSGFKACGIYPFNPNAIPDEAFKPSDVTYREPDAADNTVQNDAAESDALTQALIQPQPTETATSQKESTLENSNPKVPEKPISKSSEKSKSKSPGKTNSKSPEESTTSGEASVSNNIVTPSNVSNNTKTPTNSGSSLRECELFSTPKIRKSTRRTYKKAINAEARILTRELFGDSEPSEDDGSDIDFDVEPVPAKKKKTAPAPPQRNFLKELNKKFEKMGKRLDEPKGRKKPGAPAKKNKISNPNQKESKPVKLTEIADQSKAGPRTSKAVVGKSKAESRKVVKKPIAKPSPAAKNESWYCFLCHEDVQRDMRKCDVCASYVHEECAGLTQYDLEVFVCPNCD